MLPCKDESDEVSICGRERRGATQRRCERQLKLSKIGKSVSFKSSRTDLEFASWMAISIWTPTACARDNLLGQSG